MWGGSLSGARVQGSGVDLQNSSTWCCRTPLDTNTLCLLTLAVLAVLVACSDGVHAVAGGAVGGWTV